jgi:tetratricopeptide (TPR) repeat protein
VELLPQNPRRAAEYFRWAALLQPDWADPLEGWRTALLLSEPRRLPEFMLYQAGTEVTELADSLRHEASLRAPMQFRPFEGELVQGFVRSLERRFDPLDTIDTVELQYHLEEWVRDLGDYWRAMFAYSNHDIDLALDFYGDMVQDADSTTRGYWISERAHVMAVAGRYEEARVEYDSALAALRKTESERLVIAYISKADQLHSMGLMAEVMNDPEQARRDYMAALEEDLGYYPAHEGLARLALLAGDTANAVFEYQMAVELAPDAPDLRMKLVGILVLTGDVEGARTNAAAAAETNPYYAVPHLVMGALAERGGKRDEAVEHYERFLELAPRADRNRPSIQNRVAALETAAGDTTR